MDNPKMITMDNPKLIVLFSGKRKSGKDYITEKFLKCLPDGEGVIVRVSGPLKQEFATRHGLDFHELLSTSQYKEKYRKDMIDWGQGVRASDPRYFIDRAIDMYHALQYPIWLVSDLRYYSDLNQFRMLYGDRCVTVRLTASEETRAARGWVYTAGVDDSASELEMDTMQCWDYSVDTSESSEEVQPLLETLRELCLQRKST